VNRQIGAKKIENVDQFCPSVISHVTPRMSTDSAW